MVASQWVAEGGAKDTTHTFTHQRCACSWSRLFALVIKGSSWLSGDHGGPRAECHHRARERTGEAWECAGADAG